MNVFDEALSTGRIAGERDLKILFWTLAKKLHPDTASFAGEQAFIKLKKDFDEAALALAHAEGEVLQASAGRPDFKTCARLFSDLIASNFPMARKEGNKKYVERILALNRELGLFGFPDLFLDCERELLDIRGTSIVMNHDFNLVRLYLYNLSDFFSTGNYFSKVYIRKSRESLMVCLQKRGALKTVHFVGWLLAGLAP